MLLSKYLFAILVTIVTKIIYKPCESVNNNHHINEVKLSFLQGDTTKGEDTPDSVKTGETVAVATNKTDTSATSNKNEETEKGEVKSETSEKEVDKHSQDSSATPPDANDHKTPDSHAVNEGIEDKKQDQSPPSSSTEATVSAHGSQSPSEGSSAPPAGSDEHEDEEDEDYEDEEEEDQGHVTPGTPVSNPETASEGSEQPKKEEEKKEESAGVGDKSAAEESLPGPPGDNDPTPPPPPTDVNDNTEENKDKSENEQTNKEGQTDKGQEEVEADKGTGKEDDKEGSTQEGDKSEEVAEKAQPTEEQSPPESDKANQVEQQPTTPPVTSVPSVPQVGPTTQAVVQPHVEPTTPAVAQPQVAVQAPPAQTPAPQQTSMAPTQTSGDTATPPNQEPDAYKVDLNNLNDAQKKAVTDYYSKPDGHCSVDCTHSCKSQLGGPTQCVSSTDSSVSCSTFDDPNNLTCPNGYTPCVQPTVTGLKSFTLKSGPTEVGALEVDGSNFNKCMGLVLAPLNGKCDKGMLVPNLLFTSDFLNLDYQIEVGTNKLTFSNLKMKNGEFKVCVFHRHHGKVDASNLSQWFTKFLNFLNPTHTDSNEAKAVFSLEVGTLKVSD